MYTSTMAAVGKSDGASNTAGGLVEATQAGVSVTVSAADRRSVCAVKGTVVGQTVWQTELVHNTRLADRTCHAGTRSYIHIYPYHRHM